MTRLALVAPPFAGHLYPLLQLGLAARQAGFAVSVVTGASKAEAACAMGFETHALRSIPAGALERIANTDSAVGSNPALLLRQFRENLALLPSIQRELRDLWRTHPPAIVAADSVAPVAGFVSDELRIPWLTTIATPFAIENRRGVPAYCGGWRPGGPPLRDLAGRAAIRAFKRLVALRFRREFASLGGPFPYRPDGSERIYSERAILGFGIAELEFDRDWPACFEMIGPAVACPSTPQVDYPPAPRVLVTVGTHLLWAKRRLVADVVQLAANFPGHHFVVSLGGDGEPAQPAPNVHVRPFVPYERDLPHFAAVLHHGGAGITYATILAGIPAVVVPHDYDQFDYAARIEHFGLGLRAQSIAGAAPALRAILGQSSWPELYALRDRARAYRPGDRFVAALRRVLSSQGRVVDGGNGQTSK